MSLSVSSQLDLQSLAKGRHVVSSDKYLNDKRRKKPVLRERDEQIALIEWADETIIGGYLVGEYLCHIPNEGKRRGMAASDFVLMGGRKGYPDLMLEIPAGGYPGLRIELKAPAPHNAPVTAEQKKWIKRLRDQGFRVEVCLGYEAAKQVIIEYLEALGV